MTSYLESEDTTFKANSHEEEDDTFFSRNSSLKISLTSFPGGKEGRED